MRLISGLNATTGRHVGLYPEIKDPEWYARHGIDLTALVHECLERSRALISGPVFLQSFDSSALMRLRDEFASTWPRIQLLSEDDVETLSDDPDGLTRIASYATGIGLPYQTLMRRQAGNGIVTTPFAQRLAESDLLVHPYTLRRDVPPPDGIDYRAALRFLIRELRVDAMFCDYPDDAIAVRGGTWA
jgi:glycerophosphoryl diester phosphodiesterase